jgi:hypothetical protein
LLTVGASYGLSADEFTKGEAFPSHKRSEAASAARDRLSSADSAPREPQAQAAETQETRSADRRRGYVVALLINGHHPLTPSSTEEGGVRVPPSALRAGLGTCRFSIFDRPWLAIVIHPWAIANRQWAIAKRQIVAQVNLGPATTLALEL